MSSAFIPRHKLIFIFIDSAFFAIIVPSRNSLFTTRTHCVPFFYCCGWKNKDIRLTFSTIIIMGPTSSSFTMPWCVATKKNLPHLLYTFHSIITVIPSTQFSPSFFTPPNWPFPSFFCIPSN